MANARELQFERAEFDRTSQAACAVCQAPLVSSYFLLNDKMACEACRYRVLTPEMGSSMGRFLRAAGAGFTAAVAGALLYYAISALTGYEFGLIAIVVGVGVGSAVKWGSRGRGGWRYQTLAMAFTYFAIVATYIPPIIKMIEKDRVNRTTAGASATAGAAQATEGAADRKPPTLGRFVMAVIVLSGFICALPFLAGFQNIMGLVIIGIGLYEAWKINRRTSLTISGPHAIGSAVATA